MRRLVFPLVALVIATGTALFVNAWLEDQKRADINLPALQVAKISNNLGDAKSIATHPATTTHQRLPEDQKVHLGITPGLVRISVGLEDEDDLIADLRAALEAV